jgi:hypothetical protein
MASTIGIKIANGEFYSIVEENSTVKRRLVLTTVHDGQRSVQIDLYKSNTRTMADALYIGSLVVEKIKAKPKGEPSIEMVISSDANGNITADAVDLDDGGEHQILNVSLQSLDEESREDDIPDFELENNGEPPSGLYKQAEAIRDDEEKKFPWPLVIIIGIVIVLGITAVWFFFFRDKGAPLFGTGRSATEQTAPQAPPARTSAEQPAANQAEPAQSAAPAAPPPVIQAPSAPPPPRPQTTARARPSSPVSSYNVPSVIPKEGVSYRIRWGDTLWDIAGAFYRNPWLYPRIARFNNIRNPNLIISGTTILIPPKD